jgi:hypothetical protein
VLEGSDERGRGDGSTEFKRLRGGVGKEEEERARLAVFLMQAALAGVCWRWQALELAYRCKRVRCV